MHTFCQGTSVKGHLCGSYYRYSQTRSPHHKTGCARNWVPHADLEKLVAAHLKDGADRLRTAAETDVLNTIVQGYLGVRHQLRLAVHRGRAGVRAGHP